MAHSLGEQWNQCKETLREALEPEDAGSWLPGLQLADLSPGRAVLAGIPNGFFHNRIRNQFEPLLRRSIAQAFPEVALGEGFRLELLVGSAEADGIEAEPPPESGVSRFGSTGTDASGAAGGSTTQGSSHPDFASFQHGPETRAAWEFARQAAAEPGRRYNPLFLYGAAGLGKSHLLAAIARAVAERHPDWRIVHRSAEELTIDVVEGIRRRRMPAVRELYRGADLLLIDDLHFLEVSAKAQSELLHTFDALHDAGKQLVFAANCPPMSLGGLEATLRSRLEMGLIAELLPPAAETRLRILEASTERNGLALGAETLRVLAERIGGNPRRLEGALVRIGAYASMMDTPFTAEFALSLAEPFFDRDPREQAVPVSGKAVIHAVCEEFELTQRQLRSRERSAKKDRGRRVAMYLLRERSGLSYSDIGRMVGCRAHSTVSKAVEAVRVQRSGNGELRRDLERIERILTRGGVNDGRS